MSQTDLIPRLGPLPLLRDEGVLHIGGAFQLAKPARKSVHWQAGDWSVLAPRQLSWLIVRGPATSSDYDETIQQCVENLQSGLDLVSANLGVHLVVTDVDNEHIVWWPTGDGLVVRYVVVDSMMFDGSGRLTVRDKAGGIVQPVTSTGPAWHESFRYYRLSQTTSDLFDAYRNAYLALEAILSDVTPQKLKANGNVAEGEGDWFRRSLTVADRMYDLRQWTPSAALDPVDYLLNVLYKGTRSAVSHAKAGRRVLLPQSAADRAGVVIDLKQLLSVYQGIAATRLGVRWSGGWMSPAAKNASLSAAFENLQMFVSDDEAPLDKSETQLNPSGGMLREMTPRESASIADGVAMQRWSAPPNSLSTLPFVRRVVAAQDGVAMSTNLLPDRLVVRGSCHFEVLAGLRMVSARNPKSDYLY